MLRLLFVLPLLLLAVAASAADPAQLRTVAERVGPSLVEVHVVSALKLGMMGQNRDLDHESDTVGVVVDASGLVAVMSDGLDPAALLKAMIGDNAMIKIDATVKEVSLRLADGTEVPAEMALKDQELGLALLRPKTATTLASATLAPAGTKARMGDELVLLNRAPRHLASTLLVDAVRVQGEVGGPQPYAILGQGAMTGGAICDAEGRVLGLASLRNPPKKEAKAEAGMDPFAGLSSGLDAKNRMPVPVLRPVEALRKLIAQAAAKGKPAEPAGK